MNGKLEDWVQKLDDKVDDHETRIGNIETYEEQFAEKMDERYTNLGNAIKGVKTQGWAIIAMILTAAVVAIIANAMK